MNRTVFKAAASTLIVSLTMVALHHPVARRCAAPSERAAATQGDRQAAQLHEQAARESARGPPRSGPGGDGAGGRPQPRATPAIGCCSPTSICARAASNSARATFADVLELDPSNNRAGLSFALTQIALGRPAAAVAQLEQMAPQRAGRRCRPRAGAGRPAAARDRDARTRRALARRDAARPAEPRSCPTPSPATGAAPARSPRRIFRRPISMRG